MAKVRCPSLLCRSTDCSPLGEKGKKFKVGKGALGATAGAIIGGPVGGIVGAATGFNGKKQVKMMCNKCGKIFTIKL